MVRECFRGVVFAIFRGFVVECFWGDMARNLRISRVLRVCVGPRGMEEGVGVLEGVRGGVFSILGLRERDALGV